MSTGLLIGAALAIVALSWVMAPLLSGRTAGRRTTPVPRAGAVGEMQARADVAAATPIAGEAATVPDAVGAPVVIADPALDDAAEAAIRRWRTREVSCPDCGVRPERDAVFCSNCGQFLGDRCPHCRVPAINRKARYCAECGESLAG